MRKQRRNKRDKNGTLSGGNDSKQRLQRIPHRHRDDQRTRDTEKQIKTAGFRWSVCLKLKSESNCYPNLSCTNILRHCPPSLDVGILRVCRNGVFTRQIPPLIPDKWFKATRNYRQWYETTDLYTKHNVQQTMTISPEKSLKKTAGSLVQTQYNEISLNTNKNYIPSINA